MLGAKVISLYGRDTDLAFGHLGLINIMGWADPERGDLGRPGHQRQGDPLPGGPPLLRGDAADRLGGAEGAPRAADRRTIGSAAMAIEGEAIIRRAYAAFGERDLDDADRRSPTRRSRSRR